MIWSPCVLGVNRQISYTSLDGLLWILQGTDLSKPGKACPRTNLILYYALRILYHEMSTCMLVTIIFTKLSLENNFLVAYCVIQILTYVNDLNLIMIIWWRIIKYACTIKN